MQKLKSYQKKYIPALEINDIKINTIPKWFERLKEKKSQHKKQREGKRESNLS